MKNRLLICVSLLALLVNGCAAKEIDPPTPFDILDTKQTSSKKDSKYIVYHFGATWCPPCRQMIKLVWKDKEVIDELNKHDAKLITLDADKKEHKKYFKYYKIRSYPTIVILNRGDLKTAIIRNGYMSKSWVLSVVRKKLL
jgi:thiol-disulfide isomerase/thioredoxin